jgi:hypothetical protein
MNRVMKPLLKFAAICLATGLWQSTLMAAEPAPSQSSDSVHHVDAREAQKQDCRREEHRFPGA